MRVLVVNSGSSSLKLRVLDAGDAIVYSEDLSSVGSDTDTGLSEALGNGGAIDAVGHRVVHGGDRFTDSCRVTNEVVDSLRELTDLAPLHQRAAIEALDSVARVLPDVPQVVCFDTAFHSTLPPEASTYAIPARWRTDYKIRRFGFHGLSHSYIARRAAEMAGSDRALLRVVSCHLGAGASLAAIRAGISVDTTMGFTPLEGLVMATRSGTVDPGAVLWLIEHAGLAPETVSEELEKRSGLMALAGTADMDSIVHTAGDGDRSANLAVDIYIHRLCAAIAAMVAALEGLDVLVFTGGVGENAAMIRQRAAARLGFLGVELDDERNQSAVPDVEISAPGSEVRCLVVRSREDLEIAREVRRVLASSVPKDRPRN
jgi:acetate kinase